MQNDSYREICVQTTGPMKDYNSTRLREAWRSFWKHRGEAISNTLDWFKIHEGFAMFLGISLVLFFLFSLCTILVYYDSTQYNCQSSCEKVGYEDSFVFNQSDPQCFCVEEEKAEALKNIVTWE